MVFKQESGVNGSSDGVSDDDEEEESIVVSDIGEYDTEDDDNFILEQLEALRFNFDELEMLGCEKLQREDLDVA